MSKNNEDERFQDFMSTMRVFLDFPGVEGAIEAEIKERTEEIIAQNALSGSDGTTALSEYLAVKPDNKLRFLMGISGGSRERLNRIALLFRPNQDRHDISKDKELRERICSFLLNPDGHGAVPRYIRESLRLPENWKDMIQDRQLVSAVIRNSLLPKYATAMGMALEQEIAKVVDAAGFKYKKGQVDLVAKEVDLAIPNLKTPDVLIMSSYSLTTSSSQDTRANEQEQMYNDVQSYMRRRSRARRIKMVNVVDGGGWIVRKGALRKMFSSCDKCFSFGNLTSLGSYLAEIRPRSRS